MGTNAIICAGPNHLGTRFASWVAKSEYSASFPAANLGTHAPSKVWRSSSHNPWKTAFYGYHNVETLGFVGSMLDTVAIVGHNLRARSGRWRTRIFGVGSDPTTLPSWIKPNGMPASTNVTGNHLDVDDDPTGTLDGNWLGPTATTSAWSATLDFESPSTDLAVGSATDRRCAFVVFVRLLNSLSEDTDPATSTVATLNVELLEGGVSLRDLGTKPVNSIAGQYLIFPWDASELSSAAATNLQIRLNGSGGIGGSCRVDMVAGWAELVDWDSTDVVYDSGWMTAVDDPQSTSAFGSFYPTRPPRRETTHHRAPAASVLAQKTKYVQFLLMDDHLPTAEELTSGSTAGTWAAQDGYLSCGVGWASQALELAVNRELGDLVTIDDRSIRRETYGGNLGGAQLPRRRIVSLPLENCTQAEAISIVDRLAWEGSILQPALVSVRPEDSLERRHTTIYGVLMDPQTTLRAVHNATTWNRGVTLRFLEWR